MLRRIIFTKSNRWQRFFETSNRI